MIRAHPAAATAWRVRRVSLSPWPEWGTRVPSSAFLEGDKGTVVSISGREETKRFLAGLGFTPGTEVKAVCEASGSVILDVKGSKIAIDRKMASKILFCPES